MNLGAFHSAQALWLTAIVVTAAIFSKLLGCGLVALPLGRVEALKIGVGMIPRGEVGMVVGQLGLTLGILSNEIYDIIVFMAIATTLIAPPLIKVAFRSRSRALPLVSEPEPLG
jgi:Kef-type K+ transport system membrane component KefB